MATKQARYTVIETAWPFALRAYAPIIVAEVLVDGNLDEASSKGFN